MRSAPGIGRTLSARLSPRCEETAKCTGRFAKPGLCAQLLWLNRELAKLNMTSGIYVTAPDTSRHYFRNKSYWKCWQLSFESKSTISLLKFHPNISLDFLISINEKPICIKLLPLTLQLLRLRVLLDKSFFKNITSLNNISFTRLFGKLSAWHSVCTRMYKFLR